MKRLEQCPGVDRKSAIGGGRRRGVTLVEVLALTALVFVGVALTVPGLQAAQLRARRASCINNLKQMGLALHNYHSANDSFPMSRVAGGKGHGVGHSGFAQILPYMEMSPIYNGYNFHLENWHAANITTVRTQIATYICPDNKGDLKLVPAAEVITPDGPAYPGSRSTFARSHYGMNWGGGHPGFGDDFVKANGSYRGVLVPVQDDKNKDKSRNIGLRDITDGTSNTLAIAEKRDSQGWGVGGWGGSEFDVGESPAYQGDDPRARRVFSGSPHEGGLNILFCDGAARFLPASIDRKVWYALITRDGNEVIKSTDLEKAP